MVNGRVVIVGGGQAGFQAAVSLRQNDFGGDITIVEAGGDMPYQRPPLSKAYLDLAKDAGDASLPFRPESFYERHEIDLRTGCAVDVIERPDSRVRLSTGEAVEYDALVLALGSRPRGLALSGVRASGVHTLHTVADARAVRAALGSAQRVVVVGGGFIGLEVAAAAITAGCRVTVVEAADRVMGRVVSPELSAFVTGMHEMRGTTVLVDTAVAGLRTDDGHVRGVELVDGSVLPADLVVIGVGVVPNTELARSAGLAVENGIVVDETLSTVDSKISAIGDCAAYPSVHTAGMVRLESVQNATDHARCVAARIAHGSTDRYAALPWFWTHQFDLNVQIAGIGRPDDEIVATGDSAVRSSAVRSSATGGSAVGKFSVLRFRDGRLACVESVNSPADHMAARKILGAGVELTPAEAAASDFTLKEFARRAAPGRVGAHL
ncbi:NAD(P)/FAD-dependent oxidoreductase [Gordonia sp. NPDC003425]